MKETKVEYEIHFPGRKNGAIGIFYRITAYRLGVTPEDAVDALSDEFERTNPPHYAGPQERPYGVRARPFPHEVACPHCLAKEVCNSCGVSAPKSIRCTNGHCPACCKPKHHPGT